MSSANKFCLKETKLSNSTINVLSEPNASSCFDFFFFFCQGFLWVIGEILIGIKTIAFDIIESRVDNYSLSVIVRHRLDEWTHIVTTVYGPNRTKSHEVFW